MKLIGFSGKIGSGKDTIAALTMKILLKHNLNTFEGEFKESILPTYDEVVNDTFKVSSTKLINWRKAFFADIPKEFICEKLLNKPRIFLEDRVTKESNLGSNWSDMTAREMMVAVGNGLRKEVHPNIWINSLSNNLNPKLNYIITDVRYPNEAKFIEDNGILIRVWADFQKDLDLVSEKTLDDYEFKHVIHNKKGYLSNIENQLEQIFLQNRIV